MKTFNLLIAIVTIAAAGLNAARAADLSEPRSVAVRFADLDTGTAQGAAALFQRLANAAESVCRGLAPGGDLERKQAYANCLNDALGGAIVQLNRPALSRYAAAHGVPTGNAAIARVALK